MKTRQILFIAPNKAELVYNECKEPGPGEVTVKLYNTTISAGTERARLIGDVNIDCSRPRTSDTPVFPRTCGYAGAGVVIKTGPNVRRFKEGDRVITRWGFHADYITLSEDKAFPLPDEVSYTEGSMSFIASFSMAGVRKTDIQIGQSAMVMGLGILGLFSVMFLRNAGAVPVIAVDPIKERRELALAVGADYAVDPFEEGFASKVKALCGGKGVNAAVEVTGNGKALDSLLDCMAKFGKVSLLGCTRDSDFTIDYYRKVHFPGISLVGAHTNARPAHESSHGLFTYDDDLNSILKLICGKRIDFSKLISETHSPTEAPEVFTRLAFEKNFPIGVQFDWTL